MIISWIRRLFTSGEIAKVEYTPSYRLTIHGMQYGPLFANREAAAMYKAHQEIVGKRES